MPIWTRRARILELGRSVGLDAVGACTAVPFEGTRVVLEDRRAAGLDGGMQFTYRNPARSTDPSATLAGCRSLVVGRRRYRRRCPGRSGSGRTARVARYCRGRPLRAVAAPSTEIAGVLARRREGHRGRRTRTAWSIGRRPTGPGSVGTARAPTCSCRGAAAGSCWARCITTADPVPTPSRSPTDAEPVGAASTAARPGRSSHRAWSTRGGACRGCSSEPASSRASTGARWATGSTGATTARRCARRTVAPPARRLAPRPGPRGSTSRGSDRHRRRPHGTGRSLVHT